MSPHNDNEPLGVDVLIEGLNRATAADVLARLTERETEVLVGLAHTKTRKQIARDLGISETRVAQLSAAARKKLGVAQRSDAVAAFIVARQLCDQPVYTEKHLRNANHVINKLVSDQTIKDAYEKIASNEFREYLRDLRSSGPKAWTAKYGPWWRLIAGAIAAFVIMALLLTAILLGPAMDVLWQQPS